MLRRPMALAAVPVMSCVLAQPASQLPPHLYWNIEHLSLGSP